MKVTLLRTPETQKAYEKQMQTKKSTCFMCDYKAPLIRGYWKLVPNEFPYDAIAEKHDMLVYHTCESEASEEAIMELKLMKDVLFLVGGYDAIIENAPVNRTVPQHYHLHLIKYKTV